MLAEIRRLEPKPGLAFTPAPIDVLVPDVLVRPAADGSLAVELNPDTLPRILLNRSYYAEVAKVVRKDEDKSFLSDCLQTASWLTRSLDQRARTILKVAAEIVRQQEGFFRQGVAGLAPADPQERGGSDRDARIHHLPRVGEQGASAPSAALIR